MTLALSSHRTGRLLFVVAVTLSLLSLAVQVIGHMFDHNRLFGLTPVLHVGSDTSLPTWWSSLQLGLCAALLVWIATAAGPREAPFWWALAAISGLMSVDEVARIHENLGGHLGGQVKRVAAPLQNWPTYAWVIPGSAAVLAFALCFLRFFLRLPSTTRRYFGLAFAILVAGAIGVESLGGYWHLTHGTNNLTIELLVVIEEFLEMAAIALFATGLLDYLGRQRSEMTFRVEFADTGNR